jgi:hypothetical protein
LHALIYSVICITMQAQLEYVGPRSGEDGRGADTAAKAGGSAAKARAAPAAASAYDRVLGVVCRALGTPFEPVSTHSDSS